MGDRCDACLRAGCGPGCGCVECKSILAHVSRERLRTLAANLAVAAFGQAMFDAGRAHHIAQSVPFVFRTAAHGWRESWRPGCGHTAPGFDDGKGE